MAEVSSSSEDRESSRLDKSVLGKNSSERKEEWDGRREGDSGEDKHWKNLCCTGDSLHPEPTKKFQEKWGNPENYPRMVGTARPEFLVALGGGQEKMKPNEVSRGAPQKMMKGKRRFGKKEKAPPLGPKPLPFLLSPPQIFFVSSWEISSVAKKDAPKSQPHLLFELAAAESQVHGTGFLK